MSKGIKITLIVATIWLVAGLVVTTIALSTVGFDLRRFSNVSPAVENSYTPTQGNFQRITVDGLSEDYRIVQGTGNQIEVTYYEDVQIFFEIIEQGDTLVINERHRPVFMFFNFDMNFYNRAVMVVVPQSFTGDIDIRTVSGNIVIERLDRCGALQVNTTSGDLSCDVVNGSTMSMNATSGDIRCGAVRMDKVTLGTVSGDVRCESASALSFELTTISGDIRAQGIEIGASSGQQRVLIGSTTSGDIDIVVRGSEDDFMIQTGTYAGDIRVPQGNKNSTRSIELETLSGDIRLSFMG